MTGDATWLAALFRLAVLRRLHDDPGPFDPTAVASILVIRNDNIGDVICTTPVLDALRAAFPQAHLAALVCSLTHDVWDGHPALDQLYVYPKASHGQYGKLAATALLRDTLAQIRRRSFDLALGIRSTYSSNLGWLTYASGARWRLGPRPQEARHRKWGFYFNLPVDLPPAHLHEVDRSLHYLSHLRVDSAGKRLYLKIPEEAAARAENFLTAQGMEAPPGPVVVNFTRPAYSPARQWPVERFRELVAVLLRDSHPVVVSHAPAEEGWVRQALEGLPRPVPRFASPELRDFAALVARAQAFLTPEGGPMHVSAAVGTPTLVLWATTPLSQWRPWGVPCRVVGGGGPLEKIAVAEVLAAWKEFRASLDSAGPASGVRGQTES